MKRSDGEILPQIAREAIEKFIRGEGVLKPEFEPEGYLAGRAGVFVTIHTLDGDLRGCIGRIEPAKANIVDETIDRAIASATIDSRFNRVSVGELGNLKYDVSVLHQPEPVESEDDLDPDLYGIILSDQAGRLALMLPGIPSLDTVQKQLRATKRKAGIPVSADVRIERFRVDKFSEEEAG